MEDLRLNQCGWGQFGGVAQLSSPFQALLAFLNPINAIAIDAQIGDSRHTRKTPLVLRTRPGTLWPFALLSAIAFVQPATGAPGWNVGPPGKPQAQANDKTKSDAKSKAASKPDPKAKSEAKKPEAKPKAEPKAAASKAASKTAPKTAAATSKTVPLPVARPSSGAARGQALAAPVAKALTPTLPAIESAKPTQTTAAAASLAQVSSLPPAATTIVTAAAIDVAAVKRAIELVRGSKQSEANEVRKNISDPVAKKLVEWVILRSDDSGADFGRYVAFISANSNWPSTVTLRRKAEAAAFQERPDAARVEAYFSQWPALSAKGKFAYARAMLTRGDRKTAEALVREIWRNDGFSQDVETKIYEAFSDILTRADHKARMDRRLYEKDDTEAVPGSGGDSDGSLPLWRPARRRRGRRAGESSCGRIYVR